MGDELREEYAVLLRELVDGGQHGHHPRSPRRTGVTCTSVALDEVPETPADRVVDRGELESDSHHLCKILVLLVVALP